MKILCNDLGKLSTLGTVDFVCPSKTQRRSVNDHFWCKTIRWTDPNKGSVPVTSPVVAQRVGRGIALQFQERGTTKGKWSAARPGRILSPGKTRYPLYRRLCEPQARSGRAKNLAHTGIRSPDRPARSQSLYLLSYPAQQTREDIQNFTAIAVF